METDFTGQVNVSQGILKCRRPWAEFQPYSQNGMSCYCTDCTRTPSCGSGGTGAWAFRDAGVWKCNVVR
jgi:hypothetical protein